MADQLPGDLGEPHESPCPGCRRYNSPPMSSSQRWVIAYSLCAAASLLPFLVTYRMPMADLPQHAAQIALWRSFTVPCYGFSATYEINWLTPYVLPYVAVRLLAAFTTVNTALKLFTFLAVLALPLGIRAATDYARLDPSIALLGFPLAFGFAFYWGFFNFLSVVPLGIGFVIQALRLRDEPSRRRAALLGALSLILLLSHALVFAASSGLVLLVLFWPGTPKPRPAGT